MAGVQLTHIPYKTNPQVTNDLLGGRIDMSANDAGSLMPHVLAGKLTAMGTTGSTRMAGYAQIPTIAEAGLPGYELTFWNAAYVPDGTPPNIVARLNKMFVTALQHPKVKEYLANAGVDAFPTTSAEMMKFQLAEHDKWKKILEAAGVQPE